MQTLEITRRKLNPDDFKFRTTQESDVKTIIDKPTSIYENGELRLVYLQLDPNQTRLPSLLSALDRLKFRTDERTYGLVSTSQTFGYLPRNTLRRDYCAISGMARSNPDEHALICSYAGVVSSYYQQFAPELYARHLKTVEDNVLASWRLVRTPFTSGIANKNNPLSYHLDTGNVKDAWSAMIVLKRNVKGGHLNCPEYDVGFALPHGSLILFDGQKLIHGVTPIVKTKPDGVRYSLVFYSMRQMFNCLAPDQEYKRITKLKTERTQKRARTMRSLPVDMKAQVEFPIFVPSKGRPYNATLIYILREAKLDFTAVVEPQDLAEYQRAHPGVKFLVLPQDNQGIVYARQFILDHARAQGFTRYWQIDDNIGGFSYTLDRQTYPITVRAALGGLEKLMLEMPGPARDKIALVAPDYQQFAVMADESLKFNTRAYCCVLTRTDTGLNYRHSGRLDTKEDVDFTIQHLASGYQTLISHRYAMEKPTMGRNTTGGLAEMYRAGQHERAARFLQSLWPQYVKLVRKKLGFDAQVDWARFQA